MKKNPPGRGFLPIVSDRKKLSNRPKVLFYDIETAPSLGYTWAKYEQDVIEFKREWYILSFAYKWQGGSVKVVALPDFPGYKKNPEDDTALVKALWELFDQADMTIAHNNKGFDHKKSNTRFIEVGLTPPSPYKVVDTLQVARKYFKFNSNKLDDLGKDMRLGRKIETGGYSLWRRCLQGDLNAWARMKKYNKYDVVLLEKVYDKLLPWMSGHTNTFHSESCPKCGSQKIQYRGWMVVASGRKYRRIACQQCGGWARLRQGEPAEKVLISL